MNYYRLYFMNPSSGRIERFVELERSTDAQAIEVATGHAGAFALELWNHQRKVAQFKPKNASELIVGTMKVASPITVGEPLTS